LRRRRRPDGAIAAGQTSNRCLLRENPVHDRLDDLRVRVNSGPSRTPVTRTPYGKDSVKNAVKKAVCAHQVTLSAAQTAMLDDWTTAKSVLGIG